MILYILSAACMMIAVSVFIFSWKKNIATKEELKELDTFFYNEDDDGRDELLPHTPLFYSDFKNLDARIRGDVRYNQSMYQDRKEFESIKAKVMSEQFPM